MTPTELMLFAAHRSPVIALADICEQYFNMAPATAAHFAGLHRLPVPAFRLNDSRKAPWVVNLVELAAHIDAQSEAASTAHEHSQV